MKHDKLFLYSLFSSMAVDKSKEVALHIQLNKQRIIVEITSVLVLLMMILLVFGWLKCG